MDTNAINAFLEVSKHQSFSLAAEALFISQPAISKRINLLEQQLGVKLFNRINRQVTLTEAGRTLLPKAQALRNQVEDIQRFAAGLSGTVSGPLVIGTSHHIGLRRLPPVLRHFNKQYPDVQLDIHFEDSEQACQAVERGELEIAIATLPETVPPQLQTRRIWVDQLYIVTSPRHALHRQTPVSLAELAHYPCVLPSKDTYTYQILQHRLEPYQVELDVRMSTNYIETLKMLVSSGFGWSLLPHTMLDESIVRVPVALPLQRALGTVIHRKRTLSNAANALLEMLGHFAD